MATAAQDKSKLQGQINMLTEISTASEEQIENHKQELEPARIYDAEKEYRRQGFNFNEGIWRLKDQANENNFEFSPTYPAKFVVPDARSFSDSDLQKAAEGVGEVTLAHAAARTPRGFGGVWSHYAASRGVAA